MEDQGAYLPSRSEIDAACVVIQASWTDDERRRRRWGLMPGQRHAAGREDAFEALTIPVIHVDPEVAAALEVM